MITSFLVVFPWKVLSLRLSWPRCRGPVLSQQRRTAVRVCSAVDNDHRHAASVLTRSVQQLQDKHHATYSVHYWPALLSSLPRTSAENKPFSVSFRGCGATRCGRDVSNGRYFKCGSDQRLLELPLLASCCL